MADQLAEEIGMAVQIALNEKFACFAFTNYSLAANMPAEVQLSPRLWVARSLDLDVAKHWDEWMGSVRMDALRDSNFVMYATRPADHPNVNDQDNIEVVKPLDYLLHGILLHGVPVYEQGFSLNGANVDGDINVQQFSDLREYQPSFRMPRFRLGLDELKRAASLMNRLQTVNTGGNANWARLRRGLKVMLNGTRTQNDGGDRLHQFVRAIEALVKPGIGKTAGQFVHRVSQTFTFANDETRDTLEQLFHLRSHVEHMHLVHDALDGPEPERIAIVNRRTRQIDVLARAALRRVMESDALFKVFQTDAGIDAFWKMSDADRLALWGQRLDIRQVK
jgi:hypothetical protein